MKETPDSPTPSWSTSPTAKAKNAVQRSVAALLDALAPDRVLRRVEVPANSIEQHRTLTGCVLQAVDAALSVSWFSEPSEGAALGELHVISWRGRVALRGGKGSRQGGATIVAEIVLRPIEPIGDECRWRGLDGTEYDTAAIAAKCMTMLESQIATGG